jgi:hypothetical protein
MRPPAGGRHFQLILLKPSHYDDDGYVIRWWRAMIPSLPTARCGKCSGLDAAGEAEGRFEVVLRDAAAVLDADNRLTRTGYRF